MLFQHSYSYCVDAVSTCVRTLFLMPYGTCVGTNALASLQGKFATMPDRSIPAKALSKRYDGHDAQHDCQCNHHYLMPEIVTHLLLLWIYVVPMCAVVSMCMSLMAVGAHRTCLGLSHLLPLSKWFAVVADVKYPRLEGRGLCTRSKERGILLFPLLMARLCRFYWYLMCVYFLLWSVMSCIDDDIVPDKST